MINIVSVNKQSKIINRQYDNRKCKFTEDGNDIIINIRKVLKSENIFENKYEDVFKNLTEDEYNRYFYYKTSDKKYSNPSIIKLLLGNKCNFNCLYCRQEHNIDTTNISDVNEFITKFNSWCTSPKNKPIKIEFWGGEPFLYFDRLKEIVSFFNARFDYPIMSVISNGSLLNEEIINFLLSNDIMLVISHDGPTTLSNRTLDPLENPNTLKMIRLYAEKSKGGIGFNGVLSKSNYDIENIRNYIVDKVGIKDKVIVNFEGIVNMHTKNLNKIDLFNNEDYIKLISYIKKYINEAKISNIPILNQKFEMLIGSWINPNYIIFDNSLQKCGMDNPFTIAVDLKGNLLVCHNIFDGIIGSVYDLNNVNLYGTSNSPIHWSEKDKCRNCTVLSICHGSCFDLKEKAFTETCNNEYHFNLAFFIAAYEFVFEEEILSIEENNEYSDNI